MTKQYPVGLKLVATVTDPDSGEVIETIEVDMTKPAPMQGIAVTLDGRGYAPLTYDALTRRWLTTARDARRT